MCSSTVGYKTISENFEELSRQLKVSNEYVYKLFMKTLSTTIHETLWYNHCHHQSDKTNMALCSLLRDYLFELDEELLESVVSDYKLTQNHLEVSQHFQQDKGELELWQEFEQAISVDVFQETLDMYRNEY